MSIAQHFVSNVDPFDTEIGLVMIARSDFSYLASSYFSKKCLMKKRKKVKEYFEEILDICYNLE